MRLPYRTLCTLLLSTALAATTTPAQEMRVVVRSGVPILGSGGNLEQINKIWVTDSGLTFINARTSGPVSMDDVMLINGFLSITEGDAVANPPGEQVNLFPDIAANYQGFLGWPLDLTGPTKRSDSGIYWNTVLLAQEGSPIFATEYYGDPVPSGATYWRLNSAKINDENQILWAGQIDDGSTSGRENAIVLLDTDGKGNLVKETILAWQDLDFPPTGEVVDNISLSNHQIALTNGGGWAATMKLGNDTEIDSVIVVNGEVVLRERDEVIPGRPIKDVGATQLDMNGFGEWLMTGSLEGAQGSNAVLVVNGAVYAQESQVYPNIAPHAVNVFDSAPHYIANSGDVFWYVTTNESASTDQYILRNKDEVVLQENTTIVEGETITKIEQVGYSFHVSPSGRFLVARVENANGNQMLVLADFGTSYPLNGCSGVNQGVLSRVDGDARPGQTIDMQMSAAQSLGALGMVYWSLESVDMSLPTSVAQCGLNHKFGEIMVNLSPALRLGTQMIGSFSFSPIDFEVPIPNDLSLVNLRAYGQGVWLDTSGLTGVERVRLTNGFYIEIGAP